MSTEPAKDKTDAMIDALRARYRAALGATLATLETLGSQIETTPDAAPVLESLRREMHRLHGSAGSYGFPQASHLAGALEDRIETWRADPQAEPTERSAVVGNFIRSFRASVLGEEGRPSTAVTATVLLAGLPDGYGAAIESEAVLRGFVVQFMEKAEVSRESVEAAAPRVLVLPVALLKRFPKDFAVPVIAVAGKGGAASQRRAATDAAAMVVDASEPPGALLDLVDEIFARREHGGATLLVVDDDPAILAIVRALAEHDGLRVVTLDSPSGLQAAIDRESPTMLLMDIQMGDQDGISTTRVLRSQPRNRDLPILLFSGSLGIATREAAFRAGADDFFAKPIVPQELRQRLHQRLERRRLRRVAEGMHGVIDVTLAKRTARDGAAAWAQDSVASVVVVHPAPGFDNGAWLAEVQRLAQALKGESRAFGFHEGDALLAVLGQDAAQVVTQLEQLRSTRPDVAPSWHAGVAARGDVEANFDRARRAALEALDVARRAGGSGVHRWTQADDAVAPDVIVVEDDIALSDMVQYALRSGGYTYRAFADGKQAHDALVTMRTGNRRPVILLDVDLPGMDGHTLHERLGEERPGAFVVVFLSVHSAEGDQVRALSAGAWDYLAKPLNVRVLMAKLPIWISRAAAEK